MPDFTVEVYSHCRSVEECAVDVSGSKGNTYRVRRGRTLTAQNGWVCGCPGYKFRGNCKHVRAAREHPDYCGWQEFVHGGEPVKQENGFACPNCGGPAVPLRYAV